MLGCERGAGVRRWFTLVTGLLECLCFAGAVFGWASLVFVLKTEGYFSNLCVNATRIDGTEFTDCSGQDEQFSLIFTIASFMNNVLLLPNGFLFDHFGTMVARLLGISLYTMGALFVAFSSSTLSTILYPALAFIAVGGILFLVTNMQVGNLFGSARSTIITLYNGAFDSSSALFLIVKLLFEAGVSLRASFLFLAACGVIHLVRTFLLMPRTLIPYPPPEGYTYGVKTCCTTKTCSPEQQAANDNAQSGDVTDETPLNEEPVEKVPGFRECFLSKFFLWHLVWLSVMQLRHYLFIGTLNPVLQRLTQGDPSLVSTYTNAFAVTQLCGVLCAPWNGLIMDRLKGKPRAPGQSEREADLQASVLSLSLTALQCLLFSICASTPFLPIQYLTFALQVLNRSFLYGGNAAFISIAFPACHFGKLYGTVMALSAVASLLQYPCFTLVKGVLGGDPLYVNIFLTLLTLLAFIHPVCVYLHCRRMAALRTKSKDTLPSPTS
ncbi:solute carrier family 43 member 3b [Esox lucius]|uniref:Solute carrier family 43 member 3a n=1 Tax=Esox lucius TaxID=8010 RepID=A0A3P8ZA19_ESOLU|nr:solute carrier family 43 member 3b [Esox lucius]